ncbi:hypothetical protein AAU61_17325 [Desulfocarbo indianensis]|nr:hypothetical protein AAU61_17325 [Desulfocarbo indianensis]
MRLDELQPGGRALISEVRGKPLFISRVCALGFTPGTEVLMVRNHRRGPLIAYLRDTLVALGRPEAAGVRLLARQQRPVAEERG